MKSEQIRSHPLPGPTGACDPLPHREPASRALDYYLIPTRSKTAHMLIPGAAEHQLLPGMATRFGDIPVFLATKTGEMAKAPS